MNKNQKGFSIFEILVLLLLASLVGFVGWYVMNNNKKATESDSSQSQQNTEEQTDTTLPNSTPYTFDKLGLTMDILDGWKVAFKESSEYDEPAYDWTVGKEGEDYHIRFSSSAFVGGFPSCEDDSELTRVFVRDTAGTKNDKFMLLAWSYYYSDETTNRVSIVPVDEENFTNDNDLTAPKVKNSKLTNGNYYFCISDTYPGMDLGLVESSDDYSRHDSINVLDSKGSSSTFSTDAASYTDIKSMLTTLR